jgi:hypothetical protein
MLYGKTVQKRLILNTKLKKGIYSLGWIFACLAVPIGWGFIMWVLNDHSKSKPKTNKNNQRILSQESEQFIYLHGIIMPVIVVVALLL